MARYVVHFLGRLEPFGRAAVELQGGSFDKPDRLFRDVPCLGLVVIVVCLFECAGTWTEWHQNPDTRPGSRVCVCVCVRVIVCVRACFVAWTKCVPAGGGRVEERVDGQRAGRPRAHPYVRTNPSDPLYPSNTPHAHKHELKPRPAP